MERLLKKIEEIEEIYNSLAPKEEEKFIKTILEHLYQLGCMKVFLDFMTQTPEVKGYDN